MNNKIIEPQDPQFSNKILENIVLQSLIEARRKRRWNIFFKLTALILLLTLFWPFGPIGKKTPLKSHIALIDIKGEIEEDGSADASHIASSLNQAFKDTTTQAILLRINSPGGSAVQAIAVYDEIRRLENKYKNIKVYAVCTDSCTSAAYYIASAAHSIYANPASLVGSIGALISGFGVSEGLKKVGVERRLIVAGNRKGFLDPYSPLKPEDEKEAAKMVEEIHAQFIKDVETGRGDRLKKTPDIYSGLAWTGRQALAMGLIDGLGSPSYVARELIKNENIVDYTSKPNYFERLANRIGTRFESKLSSRVEF